MSDCTPHAVIMFLIVRNKNVSAICRQPSSDLAPSYYYLFGILKTSLGEQHFITNTEVKKWARAFFANLDRSVYDAGLCKLVPRYEKCLEWCEIMSKNNSSLTNKYEFVHISCIFFRWFSKIWKLTFGTPLVVLCNPIVVNF